MVHYFVMMYTSAYILSIFQYFFSKRTPYDCKNPFGYSMTIFMQFVLAFRSFQHIGCFVSLAIGEFMFAMAFVKILENELHAINNMASDEKCRNNMYKKLSEFMHRHANVKQLSGNLIFKGTNISRLFFFADWSLHFPIYTRLH